MIPILQLEALLITVIVFVLSLVLTFILTKSYIFGKKRSTLFWSLGMWSFTIGVLLEILFALNIYSPLSISAYLFVVAILVEFLALGSIQLIKSEKLKKIYSAFCLLSTLFMVYTLAISHISSNLITNYIAYGLPPLLVIYSSSIITFPAAAVLIIVALSSYLKGKDFRNIVIIVGVVEVSIAGTLYIVSFPSLLYVAEFIGIVLLWIGFYRGKPKKV